MTVIPMTPKKKRPEPLSISEYSLRIGGDTYTVRRAVAADQRGFVTIIDEDGKPVLVFSASFPNEYTETLIVAWRTGFSHGLERGRCGRKLEPVR